MKCMPGFTRDAAQNVKEHFHDKKTQEIGLKQHNQSVLMLETVPIPPSAKSQIRVCA